METVEMWEHDGEGGRIPAICDGVRLTTERIDCNETVDAGGCPFTNAEPPPGQVTGMLGTYCWYRGKYGNWLVRALNGMDPEAFDDLGDDNFYGTDEEGLYRPPEACLSLADQMESALDERDGKLEFEGEDVADEVRFAIWYLRWVAKECEGMDAWF
jgi:hypothetical protein|tara:strand:+ start:2259 stop:2729 length:471 start_codon:yes stop_codon:yes gene_type:complete